MKQIITADYLREFDFIEEPDMTSSTEYKVFTHKDKHMNDPGFYIFLFNDGRVFIGHDLIDTVDDGLYVGKP